MSPLPWSGLLALILASHGAAGLPTGSAIHGKTAGQAPRPSVASVAKDASASPDSSHSDTLHIPPSDASPSESSRDESSEAPPPKPDTDVSALESTPYGMK